MEKMEIYNKARNAPPEALRKIAAGRLKGKSDINPMCIASPAFTSGMARKIRGVRRFQALAVLC